MNSLKIGQTSRSSHRLVNGSLVSDFARYSPAKLVPAYHVTCHTPFTLSYPPKHCLGDATRRGVFFLEPRSGLNTREQIGQARAILRPNQANEGKLINNMPTKCPVMNAFTTKGKVVPVYCGQWSCKRCQRILARQWAYRARLHIEAAGRPAYFWTLTLRPSVKTAGQGFKALPKLWDTLRKKVQRKVGRWQYIAFVEGHPKRGNIPHFHIISMVKSPGRIKDLAMYAGFGYQAREKRVDGPGAASYVAKYASKQNEATPRGFRRVRSSRDWHKLPEGEFDGFIVKAYTETVSQYLMRVHDVTDVPMETLLSRWADAHHWEDS